MRTIDHNIENELIIKNSKFITILIKITTTNDIDKYLKETKEKYPKATHYCYAYIINNYKKSSDDGEPGGTAGMPILNVLEKENITNVLAITIRYFGGIKLGSGGLVRAYSKGIRESLQKVKLNDLVSAKEIEITINYDMQKQLDYLLKTSIIIDKVFNEQVTYKVIIEDNNIDSLKNYNYKILNNTYIEK